MDKNSYTETDPIFRSGDTVDGAGRNVRITVNRLMAEHQRLLQKPYTNKGTAPKILAGRRISTLDDGTVVETKVNPFGLSATLSSRVYAPPAKFAIDKDLLVSGLFNGTNDDPYLDGYFRRVSFVQASSSGWFRTEFEDTTELLDSLAYDYKAGVDPMGCTGIADSAWTGPKTAYAGMYTGEMRKVAQLLYGMGEVVPYSYCGDKTHGVYITPSGTKWVIEISTDDGITAWPLETEATSAYVKSLGVAYAPVPNTTLPLVANRVLLADASILATYAIWGPAYPECGWAFDATGHNAVNVMYEYEEDPVLAYKTHLLKIAIMGDDDGPISASIFDTESAYLYTSNHSLFSIKFPRYYGPVAELQSLYVSNPDSSEPPEEFDNAPIHAWYDGLDLIVVRQRAAYYSLLAVDERPDQERIYGCFYGNIGTSPSSGSGNYERGEYRTNERCWAEVDGGVGGFDAPYTGWEARPRSLQYNWVTGGPAVTALYYDGQVGIASETHTLYETFTLFQYDLPLLLEVVIIPFHERQGVFIYRTTSASTGETVTASSKSSTYSAGTFEIDYRYSAAYCITPDCVCGGNSPSGEFKFIGRWGIKEYLSITDPAGLYGAQALEIFGDDLTFPDRTLWCYIDSDIGDHSCSVAATVEVTQNGPKTENHEELRLVYGKTYDVCLANDVFDPYNDFTARTDNVFAPISGQWMDVCLDVFTRAGSASKTASGISLGDRVVMKNADAYYPIDEVNTRSVGWFGVPFPEMLEPS